MPLAQQGKTVRDVLKSSLDHVSHHAIRGWAYETDTPDAPVRLLITVDGELLQRVIANQYRADLDREGFSDGRHSFGIELLKPLDFTRDHAISVTRESDGVEVFGSPKVVPGASALDEATRARLTALLQAARDDEDVEDRIGFLTDQVRKLLDGRAARSGDRDRRSAIANFRRRWGAAPAEATGGARYQALVMDAAIPVVGRDAGSNVLLSHMHSLQRLDFKVYFASLSPPSDAAVTALEAEGVTVCREPWFATPEEALKRLGPDLDVVYLHRVDAAAYLAHARRHARRARLVYSVADLHHLRTSREAVAEKRPDLSRLAQSQHMDEIAAAFRADVVLTHSSHEAELLRRATRRENVHLVRWAVATADAAPDLSQRRGAAFIGSYLHRPNLAAARELVNVLLPRLQEQDPSFTCMLVGSDMPEGLRLAARPGLEIKGRVPELRVVLDAVRMTLAPLSFGAGVKGKVVDSLAAGVPCVCSPIAAEGLDLPAELQPTVGALPQEFIGAALRLHQDADLAQHSAEVGLAYVRDAFSAEKLDEALSRALCIARLPPAIPSPIRTPDAVA
jgi:O-antigen biosynthesis protein